jgi:hypothetical protein
VGGFPVNCRSILRIHVYIVSYFFSSIHGLYLCDKVVDVFPSLL